MEIYDNNINKTFYSRKNNYKHTTDAYFFNTQQQIVDNKKILENTEKKLHNSDYKITRINIDSSYRNLVPKNIISNNNSLLPNNPLLLFGNTQNLYIYQPNHGFALNDKITINNCSGNIYYIKNLYITKNSYYIRILHKAHTMQYSSTISYFISISNVIGSSQNNTYILNIPINLINDVQQIYFNTDGSTAYDPDYYYIKINVLPIDNYNYSDGIFNVTYKHIAGIPTNNLNANYPINYNQLQGFQIVASVINNNWYTILLNTLPLTTNVYSSNVINSNTVANVNSSYITYGGNNITVSLIKNIIPGFPDSNTYTINLNKTFHNLKKIKLISTEFPNTEKVINDHPINKQNNLFYWKLLNDGDHMYSIGVSPGNYTTDSLVGAMTAAIQSVQRINPKINDGTNYQYNNNNSVSISIDTNVYTFTITFYNQIFIDNPFTYEKQDSFGYYYIVVYHPSHNLSANTSIIISNAIDFYLFTAASINGTQTIDTVITNNYYSIKLNKFNPNSINSTTSNNGGGVGVSIQYAIYSRLYFDKPGTIGNLLGFRDVGSINAITPWSLNNSNNSLYLLDTNTNKIGTLNKSSHINNYINLNGSNYILMACNLFEDSFTYGNIKGVFAKILLSGLPGSYLFNQYIQLAEEVTYNISSIFELEFNFFSPTGELYDFNNLDHSFTLEIYESIQNIKHLTQQGL